MGHVYTMKKNAVRAAKKAGLDASAVYKTVGGYAVGHAPAAAHDYTSAVLKATTPKKAKPKAAAKASRDYPREGTKNHKLLDMLTRDGGAAAAQLEAALGWKQPTIRTAIQRVTKQYGLSWRHVKGEDGAKSRWEASRAV